MEASLIDVSVLPRAMTVRLDAPGSAMFVGLRAPSLGAQGARQREEVSAGCPGLEIERPGDRRGLPAVARGRERQTRGVYLGSHGYVGLEVSRGRGRRREEVGGGREGLKEVGGGRDGREEVGDAPGSTMRERRDSEGGVNGGGRRP